MIYLHWIKRKSHPSRRIFFSWSLKYKIKKNGWQERGSVLYSAITWHLVMQEWRSIGSEALGKRLLCQKQKCTCGECKIAWKESYDHQVEEISIEHLVIWQYPQCSTWSYIGTPILSSSLLPICCRDHVSWWILVPLVFLVTSVRTKYRILDHFCHNQYWHILSLSITLSFDIGMQTARKLNNNVSSEKPMANTSKAFSLLWVPPHTN